MKFNNLNYKIKRTSWSEVFIITYFIDLVASDDDK